MLSRKPSLLVMLIVVPLVQSCIGIPQQSRDDYVVPTFASSIPFTSLTPDPLPASANNDLMGPATSLPLPIPKKMVDVSSLSPDFWMDLPVVPVNISNFVREIYARGLLMGNDPKAFSKVGDCHSTNPYFLADFDLGPNVYNLGDYSELQPTIDYFNGSFGRTSFAVKQGLSTAGVLASLWSDWKQCTSNETPLDCEFRSHNPSFAIISLGTNEAYDVKLDKTPFEGRLRQIIEHSIDQGVVPILSTKADNDEGDNYINFVTAKLAVEYDLPLWNFWKAVQAISQHGMRSADHLTFAPTNSFTDFSRPEYLDYGMQIRNLTALQMLDMIRREINRSQVNVAATPTAQPTNGPPSVHQAGETMISDVDGMTLVYVSSGVFEMGSGSGNLDELPLHMVSLDGYWMDTTEVTNTMFASFLNDVGNQVEGGISWLNSGDPLVWITNVSGMWEPLKDKGDYPVVGVSWYGAKSYCEWADRSLPTEAQWEYAAKGAAGYRFPWGDQGPECTRSQFLSCGDTPVQVGILPLGANPYGIYDLAGNVAEWVNDRYAADYYQQSPAQNPSGPMNGYYRIYRGGSWGSSYIGLQSSHRSWAGADTRNSEIGFRCVLNP